MCGRYLRQLSGDAVNLAKVLIGDDEVLSMRNIIHAGRHAVLPSIGMLLMLFVFLSSTGAQDDPPINSADSRDRLAYVSDDHHLILYDPHDRTEITLVDDVGSFVLGRDGRIAFTRPGEYDTGLFVFDSFDENDTDLYVFDPSTPALMPANISQNSSVYNYPLAWSPDGRYLAFGSYQKNIDHSIYVWNGETITNITPENGLDTAEQFYVDWSRDGRLAFTVIHGWSSLDIPAEIYVWDGNRTMNLSQNPKGEDGSVHWSTNGQLMFGSYLGERNGIYVWDGVSFKDGIPDVDSFIRLAPDLHPSSPMWVDDSIVGFTVYPEFSPSGMKEIILWDLEHESIVKQFAVSSDNAWSWLAEGGQIVLSSSLASGSPSYYLDVENTAGDILLSIETGEISWSADGYLAYCQRDEESMIRVLSIWDGEETWVVARVSYRPIQWQHGRNTFSCNNG
jgi:WD40 repeat protein